VAADQFFGDSGQHKDWAAQAAVYYDAAARLMKLAEGCEQDKEIKTELTKGAAECVRRAKELRDSLAPSTGCPCSLCKNKGAPKKQATKGAPVKEVTKDKAAKPEAPKKELTKEAASKGAPKKEATKGAPTKETPKQTAPAKETPKQTAPTKQTPKQTAPVCVPVYYTWPVMQWCYTPCVPMVCCVAKK